jgi:hypothetical protein
LVRVPAGRDSSRDTSAGARGTCYGCNIATGPRTPPIMALCGYRMLVAERTRAAQKRRFDSRRTCVVHLHLLALLGEGLAISRGLGVL